MKTKSFKILISFLAVYLVWGSTYLAIRVIVTTMPPFWSMGMRFLSAALIIFVYLLFKRQIKFNKKEFLNASMIGILWFVGGVGVVAWSELYVPSGITSIIVALIPLWFLLWDSILNKRPSPQFITWIGISIGLAGVFLLVGFNDLSELKGVSYLPFALIILSTFIWSFGSVLSPKLKKPKHGLTNLCVQLFAGGLVNMIVGLFLGEHNEFKIQNITTESFIAFVYLVILGSIFVMNAYNYLLENVKPNLVATYSYVNPLVALFLGWLLLNEEINIQIILASVLILIGVVFIKKGEKSGQTGVKRAISSKQNQKKLA